MPMSTVRAARGTLCLPDPPPAPAACLPPSLLFPGEQQQQQQQLFSILKITQNPSDGNDGSKTISFCSLVVSREQGAGKEPRGRVGAEVATRGTWNCSCGASLTSLRCKCVHNAAKFRECKQKRPKAQWQLCRRVAFASPSCLSFVYSFDNLHLKEL